MKNITGKELLDLIKDNEYDREVLELFDAYEIKKPKTVWDLKDGDKCWYAFDDLEIEKFDRLDSTNSLIINQKAYLTEQGALDRVEYLKTRDEITRFKAENDTVELDWGNYEQAKYYIYFRETSGNVLINWLAYALVQGSIYMSSQELWEQCIEQIGEERIKHFITWEYTGTN